MSEAVDTRGSIPSPVQAEAPDGRLHPPSLPILHDAPSSGFGEKLAGWSTFASVFLFFLALWPLMHFLPPIPPSLTAEETAALYRDNSLGIRLASMVMMMAAAALTPMYAAMFGSMVRMKGRPITLAATQLASGAVVVVNFLACSFFFGAAAFRVERAAADIQLLSDLAWFFLIMPAPPACLGVLVFGLAVLADDRTRLVMPRWLGYFNVWMAVAFFPGLVMVLFHTGPFAWNSVFPFWIPVATFFPWCVIMAVTMIRQGGRISRGELA